MERPLLSDQRTYLLLAFILYVTIPASYADAIYKSVDEEGNVTYSEKPTTNQKKVKTLVPPPEASEDEINAARDRQKKLQTYLDESEQPDGESVTTDGSERREAAKRRAIWGKDWPIHEPLNK